MVTAGEAKAVVGRGAGAGVLSGFWRASAVKRSEVSYRRTGGITENILALKSGP